MTTETESRLQQRVNDLERRMAALEGHLQLALAEIATLKSASYLAPSATAHVVTDEMADAGHFKLCDLFETRSNYAAEQVYMAMEAVRVAQFRSA